MYVLIYHGILSHDQVFAIRKMKTHFTNKNTHILRTDILQKQCGRELLFLGGESLKCHFLDFGEVLTEC
jgi:hypothetical protein